MSLISTQGKGRIFIISAPAGTGKTTLVHLLMQEFPSVIANISYTTRMPREGEVHGKDYYFITESEFQSKILKGDFLEYVQLYGYYYGTSRQWILDQQNQGKHVVLVIDTQGALSLKPQFGSTLIFISPPSLDSLKERLVKRKTETSEMITKRLEWAKTEMQAISHYDYLIVNDDLQIAYQVLKSIVIAETHRVSYDDRIKNKW